MTVILFKIKCIYTLEEKLIAYLFCVDAVLTFHDALHDRRSVFHCTWTQFPPPPIAAVYWTA